MTKVMAFILLSVLIHGCLPDPLTEFGSTKSETDETHIIYANDGDFLDGTDAVLSDEDPQNYIETTFVVKDKTEMATETDLPDEGSSAKSSEEIDDDIYFDSFLTVRCAEDPNSGAVLGYVKIALVITPVVGQINDQTSITKTVPIPCAGKILFRYYGVSADEKFDFSITHLDLDRTTVLKSGTASVSTESVDTKYPLKFEIVYK